MWTIGVNLSLLWTRYLQCFGSVTELFFIQRRIEFHVTENSKPFSKCWNKPYHPISIGMVYCNKKTCWVKSISSNQPSFLCPSLKTNKHLPCLVFFFQLFFSKPFCLIFSISIFPNLLTKTDFVSLCCHPVKMFVLSAYSQGTFGLIIIEFYS